jgi:ABC-type nitrate/sulfonate/bicarbonate transport system substrate-binding protein
LTQDLSLSVFPGGFNLPLWAAERQGFFEEQGLRVVLTPTPSSTYQMQGLAEGRFDIAMTAFDNVVAYQEGQGEAKIPANPDMFAFMGSDNGFLSVIGGKDVHSLQELKGRKLAVDALTTGYAFVLRELLSRAGVAESDVTFERMGGALPRFQELLKGSHSGTILVTPFDLLAMKQGFPQLARAVDAFGSYQGVVAATRRSWAAKNEAALKGFVQAYRAGVSFIYQNKDISEALLVANIRTMTPALARQTLDILLDERSGFFRDVRLDPEGMQTVLALRSKFGGAKLTDPRKYIS